jgi:hypothetical protein
LGPAHRRRGTWRPDSSRPEAKFNFPSFDQVPNLDWDASAQDYLPRVIAAEDTEAYCEVLMEFAAQLKDGHTAVIPPWRLVRPGWDQPPVEVQVIGDRFFVARTGVSKELRNQRVYPGLETLEIGTGTPIRSHLEDTVLRLGSRGNKHADEALGLITLLSGPEGRELLLKVKDIDGTERDIALTRRSLQDDGKAFQWRVLEWYRADPSVEARNLAGGITYIRISNFMKPEGRDQFRVVSKRDSFPDGTEFVGYGITPDVVVEPTQQDLFEGRDPVLEAGIDAIANWAPDSGSY